MQKTYISICRSMSFTSGATYGKYKHTLTVNEMPAHRHGTNVLQFDTGNRNQNGGGTNATFGDTASAGGGQAHNNLSPCIGVYFWKRTA